MFFIHNSFLNETKKKSPRLCKTFTKVTSEAVDNVSLNKVEASNRNVIAVRRALAQNSRHPVSFPVLQCFVRDATTPQAPGAGSSARHPLSRKEEHGVYL